MRNNIRIVFILDHPLMGYRFPFYQQLIEKGYSVTVFHSGKMKTNQNIPQVIVKKIEFFGVNFRKLPNLKTFDIVVHMQNIRVVNLWLLTLNPFKSYKVIHWGIGVSSSKGLSLKKDLMARLRAFLARFSSAQILYSDFPLPLFPEKVLRKTFVANNTIYNSNPQDFSDQQKDSFLFIGSLNKRKGLELLIEAFLSIKEKDAMGSKLIIVGDGPEREQLSKLAANNKFSGSIDFLGNISDQKTKEQLFKKSWISISPLQAGLSVLESFSYGVPFISFENAISGGEHLNIKDGFNGFLVNSKEELVEKMFVIMNDRVIANKMGNNAYKFYMENRQMSHMVNTFDEAFKFVLQ